MFYITKRYKGLNFREIYFASARIPALENVDLIQYKQLLHTKEKIFTTLVTDLRLEEEVLLKRMEKNTRYEIRRAEREEVQSQIYGSDLKKEQANLAVCLYNQFVDTKKELDFHLTKKELALVVHFYYHDDKRVRLWLSASLFRNSEESENKNRIGRANRYLHWKDIQYFKEKGYLLYDWGGYSTEEGKDGIGKFKKDFGGEIENDQNKLVGGTIKGKIALKARELKQRWIPL